MQSISSLNKRFDVTALQRELQGDVWNRNKARTEHPRSPHREVDDIWVRNPQGQWQAVADEIPAVHAIIEEMADFVSAMEMGGVLITRVPSGCQVYPHVDTGWHAEYYEKYAIQVQGTPEQTFSFLDCEHRCAAGDSYTFRNDVPHWVTNFTDEPRITLIICVRTSQCLSDSQRE